MSYNASDPEQIRKAKDQAEFDEALKFDVIKNVMSAIPGRKWIYDWLNRCHIYHTPYVSGRPDDTAFNLGEHNIGLMLLADVQASSPDLYMQMVTEAKGSSS